MPAKSEKQANTAKLAGAVKSGSFPKSKAGPAVNAMAKMPMNKLKHFMKKEVMNSMSEAQKRRLLIGLHKLKEGYAGGGNTDITNADNMVAEEATERNSVAKTFNTDGDFDSYVNQHRGIEMTPKEFQAILGYDRIKPTQQDKFFVKFEKTDDFGTNSTTVIKKLKDGQQFCWTSFAKHASAEDEGQPDEPEPSPQPAAKPQQAKQSSQQKPQTAQPSQPSKATKQPAIAEQNGGTGGDQIRITKSITFVQDTDGANILGDFLRALDL